jgi:CheY-specific phosphatase CheX
MTEQFDQFLVAATRDVFATMLDWKAETTSTAEGTGEPLPFGLLAINGCIGFGGRITGSLFFSTPEALALAISRQLLGEHVGPSEVSDVIGEMTNMLAGGCKSRFCDSGYTVAMSIPNVIRGTRLWASSREVQFMVRRRFTVASQGESFQVVLLGKLS